jgi:mono/diheme cytochrome c family protein
MLTTIGFVVAGLATGNKIALALFGAAFIVFALVSSFALPKRNPSFPGRGVGTFLAISAVFFVAMITAVILFGREKTEKASAATTTTTASAPGPAPKVQGDPVAGKAVFASAGCVSCHTLKAAGATGTVGPNLDQLKPAEARIVLQVTNGGAVMPPFKGRLTPKQIEDVAAFVYTSTHS